MTPIDIRPAGLHDLDSLVAWAQAMAWETEHKLLDEQVLRPGIAAGLADARKARYFIAERGGAAAGTLMLTTEWSDWRNGDWWWIQSVYVDHDHRRQGVYRALYAHVHALAEDDPGVCGLRLYVEKDNVAAQRTYESLGMVDARYCMYEERLRGTV
jgi:ribosomal protein S18 acetylase RimI-like enzyme